MPTKKRSRNASGEAKPVICTECFAAKLKCSKSYPCERCVRLNLQCFPHQHRAGRPRTLRNPLDTHRESLQCYAEHCTPTQKERIADFVSLMYYKVCSLQRKHDISFGSQPELVPAAERGEDLLSQRLYQLDETDWSAQLLSPSQVSEELSRYQSWVPPDMLQLHTTCPGESACTMLMPHYMGDSHYVPNQRYTDLFGGLEAINASKNTKFSTFTLEDLRCFISGRAGKCGKTKTCPPVKRPPGLIGRVFSELDHHEVLVTLLQTYVTSTPDKAHTHSGIFHMKPLDCCDTILCHVQRTVWLERGAKRGCLFLWIQPLPACPYLRGACVCDKAFVAEKNTQISREESSDLLVSDTSLIGLPGVLLDLSGLLSFGELPMLK